MQSLGYSRERPLKRVRWTQDADLQKLDDFEKLEAKSKVQHKQFTVQWSHTVNHILFARKRMNKEKMVMKLGI
ncbi:hypothetical protein DY000_02003361 [Brassica cretica]|uniref:Uncharacterized protein n=1 Tax=Brassica cretica TaxID=69181 RepID=A0ABQ7CHC6_BRACR|nr:hypothetical protein DY000_02003361 [Brassica cretica]